MVAVSGDVAFEAADALGSVSLLPYAIGLVDREVVTADSRHCGRTASSPTLRHPSRTRQRYRCIFQDLPQPTTMPHRSGDACPDTGYVFAVQPRAAHPPLLPITTPRAPDRLLSDCPPFSQTQRESDSTLAGNNRLRHLNAIVSQTRSVENGRNETATILSGFTCVPLILFSQVNRPLAFGRSLTLLSESLGLTQKPHYK